MPLENITKTNAEVSENDLKLISYELEKFLVAEKEESFYESSGRNSHVSTITLSGKQIAGSEAEDYGNKTLCPLQGYLSGSSIELPETTEVRKERASLGELFHRTKTTSEDCTETGVRPEMQVKQTHKSAMHIMRKMLKRAHGKSKSCNTSGDDAVSASTNKKLHKVGLYYRIFRTTFNNKSHGSPYHPLPLIVAFASLTTNSKRKLKCMFISLVPQKYNEKKEEIKHNLNKPDV